MPPPLSLSLDSLLASHLQVLQVHTVLQCCQSAALHLNKAVGTQTTPAAAAAARGQHKSSTEQSRPLSHWQGWIASSTCSALDDLLNLPLRCFVPAAMCSTMWCNTTRARAARARERERALHGCGCGWYAAAVHCLATYPECCRLLAVPTSKL